MMPFPESFPVPLIYIEETDSTNHYLNDLCNKQDVSELTTVVANYQTLGRGQRGNSWESEKGKNLMFSFVLYPTSLEIRRQFLLSPLRKNSTHTLKISLLNGRTMSTGKKEKSAEY